MASEVISMREPDEPAASERIVLSAGRYVHFGPFLLDQQRQEVTQDGAKLKLQGKVYQILVALLEKPGEVVTREELRMRLWPADTHVNYDANVNTTVNKLRQALGDSSENPLYIETIPRKGYCLLVRSDVSDKPGATLLAPYRSSAVSAKEPLGGAYSFKFLRADFWIILGVIGLILAGMLLGAGIMRLWFFHVSPASAFPFGILFSHLSKFAIL